MDCVYEQMAGFLRVENCIAFMIKQAKFAGAEFAANTAVDGLDVKKDKTIVVYADGSSIKTQRLIICLGAWSKQLLDQLPFKLDILRKQQHWFQIDRHDVKWENGFPGFLIETGGGWFYGFPEVDHLGMKVAEHSGGRRIEAADSVNRECDAEELARTQQFFRDTFQFTRIRLVHYSVCMYSMSSDGHFMIDRHPECGQIVFVAGLSGHGFKFSPVIGDYLVELLEGRPDPLFQFFCLAGRDLSV
jgi:glycine/D-amino acid oxidase-like deaminating enzyme